MRSLRAGLATRRHTFASADREAGLTLVELLVASAMGVVLLGAVGSMVVSAVRTQPQLSERAHDVSTARWVLERMTREIRNGVEVYEPLSGSQVSFKTQVRRTACGGGVEEEPDQPAIQCRVAYTCTTTACTRTETAPEVESGGTPRTVVSGLGSSNVFSWEREPGGEEDVTYIGVTLRIPNPDGSGYFSISDGASLRTLTLAN